MEFREHTLSNGLEIVAECNPRAYSAAFGFFVKTGSRDENEELSGVSHFLEHMVFKGTPRRSAADVNRELDEIGSHSNAFTSEEQTVYYATMLPEYQERGVELLCDIMRPSLREDDFETEKKVILEEIAKYEDQPPFGANEKVMASHFVGHPLARSVLGTAQSVAALTPQQMRGYFERRYSPGNIALVAAGNVDFPGLVSLAQRCCGSWQPLESGRETPPFEPHGGFAVFPTNKAVQQYVVQVGSGPAAEDEDRYAGRILATILGDDSGSRLFWELIDTGRAEYAAVGSYEFQGTGIFMTFVCCAPEQAADNLKRIHDIQHQLETGGVTQAELVQAKNKICAHVVLQSERPANRLFSVGSNWIQRREYRTVQEVNAAYQRVTQSDVADVARKHRLTINTTVAVGPLTELTPPRQ